MCQMIRKFRYNIFFQTISDDMIADQQYILDTMNNLIDFNLTQTLVDHLREDAQGQEVS